MADGAVKFVSENVDMTVYKSTASRDGGEVQVVQESPRARAQEAKVPPLFAGRHLRASPGRRFQKLKSKRRPRMSESVLP